MGRRTDETRAPNAVPARSERVALVALMALGVAPLVVAVATDAEIDAIVGISWALFLSAATGLFRASGLGERRRSGRDRDAGPT